jgi:hypothetical protein
MVLISKVKLWFTKTDKDWSYILVNGHTHDRNNNYVCIYRNDNYEVEFYIEYSQWITVTTHEDPETINLYEIELRNYAPEYSIRIKDRTIVWYNNSESDDEVNNEN